ncbi:MAG: hypothetical protein EXR93_03670 [Gemmatimonadetes bacterium]|nr:hypothetical protein [Gemmatimonadota bacterium]
MLRFIHFLGFALWIGGGWATMALALRARREPPETRRALARILPAASNVILLGAALTVYGGIALIVKIARLGIGQTLGTPGRSLMMGAGMVAAILVVLVTWPASRTLARLAAEPGELSPDFEKIRKRQAIVASITGVLGLLALAGATLF